MGSGICTGGGEGLVWTGGVCVWGSHPARGLPEYGVESWVGLPSAIPIWISPEAEDWGVGNIAGGDMADDGDAIRDLWGLGSGVSNQRAFGAGYRPFPALVKAMSSLDSLFLSRLGFVTAVLLEPGPEDVLGLAGMLNGAVWLRTPAMFLDGGGGRGRSR